MVRRARASREDPVRLQEAPKVMTYDEIREAVARRSYKPGWELSTFLDPFEGPVFRVVLKIENAYRRGELIPLRINSRMPPIPDEGYLDLWILWRLSQIELHEVREFYARDGEMVFDPHDPVEPETIIG